MEETGGRNAVVVPMLWCERLQGLVPYLVDKKLLRAQRGFSDWVCAMSRYVSINIDCTEQYHYSVVEGCRGYKIVANKGTNTVSTVYCYPICVGFPFLPRNLVFFIFTGSSSIPCARRNSVSCQFSSAC